MTNDRMIKMTESGQIDRDESFLLIRDEFFKWFVGFSYDEQGNVVYPEDCSTDHSFSEYELLLMKRVLFLLEWEKSRIMKQRKAQNAE